MREDLQFFGYLINLYFQEAAPLQYRNVQGFDMLVTRSCNSNG